MAYPEPKADYKNRPAWLDRAVAGENDDAGKRALRNTMDADNRQTNETMPSFSSLKDIQAREALDISDAVPRRGENRADGGMTNAKLAQVDPDFEPAAAQDARDAAASSRSTRRVNAPMERMPEPESGGFMGAARRVGKILGSPSERISNGIGQSIGFKSGGRAKT